MTEAKRMQSDPSVNVLAGAGRIYVQTLRAEAERRRNQVIGRALATAWASLRENLTALLAPAFGRNQRQAPRHFSHPRAPRTT